MKSVQQFIKKYQQAITRQNWEELKDYFHENCAVLYSDGTYVGKPMLKQAFDKTYALMKNGEYSLTDFHFPVITDKFCSCVAKFYWSAEIYGKSINSEHRITLFIAKDDNEWKIVNQHLGPMPK